MECIIPVRRHLTLKLEDASLRYGELYIRIIYSTYCILVLLNLRFTFLRSVSGEIIWKMLTKCFTRVIAISKYNLHVLHLVSFTCSTCNKSLNSFKRFSLLLRIHVYLSTALIFLIYIHILHTLQSYMNIFNLTLSQISSISQSQQFLKTSPNQCTLWTRNSKLSRSIYSSTIASTCKQLIKII